MVKDRGLRPRREHWTTTRWPTIVCDDWSGRTRLRGDELSRVWGEWIGRIPWEIFVTLTFDSERGFRLSRDMASREAFWWLGLVARLCRKPLAWAYAIERGKSGLWHVHALIMGAGEPNWSTLEGVWRMRNGMAVAKPVHSVAGIALYTTKQATGGEVVLSDTVTLTRFKTLASGIVVALRGEDE